MLLEINWYKLIHAQLYQCSWMHEGLRMPTKFQGITATKRESKKMKMEYRIHLILSFGIGVSLSLSLHHRHRHRIRCLFRQHAWYWYCCLLSFSLRLFLVTFFFKKYVLFYVLTQNQSCYQHSTPRIMLFVFAFVFLLRIDFWCFVGNITSNSAKFIIAILSKSLNLHLFLQDSHNLHPSWSLQFTLSHLITAITSTKSTCTSC